jgi:hypothetical protein
VQQHIGVAMAVKVLIVRHVDTPQPQRPTRHGAMTVFAESDPELARDCGLLASVCYVNPRGL